MMIELNIVLPRVNETIWQHIRALNRAGDWSVWMVYQNTNIDKATVRDYVRRLYRAGYARKVRTEAQVSYYSLVRKPELAPRLSRTGSEYAELHTETIWRAIRMAKVFSIKEIAEYCAEKGVAAGSVKRYITHLSQAGIVVAPDRVGGSEAVFRLHLNLGAAAPKILRTHSVFDPNSNQIIGNSQTCEVQL